MRNVYIPGMLPRSSATNRRAATLLFFSLLFLIPPGVSVAGEPISETGSVLDTVPSDVLTDSPDSDLAKVLGHLDSLGVPVGVKRDALGAEQRRGLCLARELAGLPSNRQRLNSAEVPALLALTAPLSAPSRAVDGLNVSITCQAAWYAKDGVIIKMMRATTGLKSGWTPVGTFKVTWIVNGWSTSSIYKDVKLYRIHHFKGPVGFHGVVDPSWIKSTPASRGCVRLPNRDMDWLAKRMPSGSKVRVYGSWSG